MYIYIRVLLKNESIRAVFSNPPLHDASYRKALINFLA